MLEKSIDCLERAVDHNFGLKEWFENDSDLDNLRGDPRFAQLMERIEQQYSAPG